MLEAESLPAISRLVMLMPLRQQVNIVPVEHWLDAVATAKTAMRLKIRIELLLPPCSHYGAVRFFILEESGECTSLS